MEQSYKQICK